MAHDSSTSRPFVLHPLLFAAWPVLDLYARHTSEVLAGEVLAALGVVVALALVLYAACRAAVRRSDAAGLIVTCGIVPFFLYGAISRAVLGGSRLLNFPAISRPAAAFGHLALLLVLTVLVLLAGRAILRTTRDLGRWTRAANVAAALLVALAAVRIATAHVAAPPVAADDPQVFQAGAAPGPRGPAGSGEPAEAPDIYYIIFDRYASARVLAEAYGFDNTPFLESLRRRGFVVEDGSRCNYAMSSLSLWSSLNMRYHETLAGTDGVERELAAGHHAGRLLKERGHRYFHVWSPYVPTMACRIADVNVRRDHLQAVPAGSPDTVRTTRPPAGGHDEHQPGLLGETSFAVALLRTTPLGVVFGRQIADQAAIHHGESALLQFELLHAVAAEDGPKFVFAHLLLPHPPFAFTKHGFRSSPAASGSKRAFVEQLEFTNARIEELVDAILASSPAPPIILLQADEGPYLREDDLDQPAAVQRRIRTGILNAYLLPGRGREALWPGITPVNTFRLVLREYSGLELEPLPDRVFIWPVPGEPDEEDDARELGLAWEGHDFPGDSSSRRYVFQDTTD